MNRKLFSQRFNRELSLIGFPEELAEKTKAVIKVFGVTQHLAHEMIFGYSLPPVELLEKIATILEVCPRWLSGLSDKRKSYAGRETESA